CDTLDIPGIFFNSVAISAKWFWISVLDGTLYPLTLSSSMMDASLDLLWLRLAVNTAVPEPSCLTVTSSISWKQETNSSRKGVHRINRIFMSISKWSVTNFLHRCVSVLYGSLQR